MKINRENIVDGVLYWVFMWLLYDSIARPVPIRPIVVVVERRDRE